MTNTLIIGASGQIGKMLTQRMLENEQAVTALVRDKSKLAELEHEKLTIIEADLKDDFSHAFEHCTDVVFVAGSGGSTGAEQTLMIDLWAAVRAADYAKQQRLKHFIMVSSIGANIPSSGPTDMQPYLIAKHMADEHLINSGLCYSIIRPGTLTDDNATGGFTSTRPEEKEQAVITREDVAAALHYRVNHRPHNSEITELFNGEERLEDIF